MRRHCRPQSQAGFTLVELLVAIMAGTIVVFAAMTILFTTYDQASRTFSRIDATQRARQALEILENELQSACVAYGTTPIQGGANGAQRSSATQLAFISSPGTSPSITPVEHVIAVANGALSDTTYAAGGTAPDWTFSSTPVTATTLLTNVSQGVVNGQSAPYFQYFAYGVPTNSNGNPYQNTAGNDYEILLDGITDIPGTNTLPFNSPDPLTVPLSQSDAQNAAEVVITLRVGPGVAPNESDSDESTSYADANDTVTDSIVLRLTPVADDNSDGATFGPCQ